MTTTLGERGLFARHTPADLNPIPRTTAAARAGTPLDLAGVRDLSVRAAIAAMDMEILGAVGGALRLPASGAFSVAIGAAMAVVAAVVDAADEPGFANVSNRPKPPESAFEAVGYVAETVGLPVRDVYRAAGIAPRTYYSWKGGATPRLRSQGKLWKLVQASDDLLDIFDTPEAVSTWFRADPERRAALRKGEVDELIQDAMLDTRAPAAVEKGSKRSAINQLAAVGRSHEPEQPPRRGRHAERIPAGGRVVTRPATGDKEAEGDGA